MIIPHIPAHPSTIKHQMQLRAAMDSDNPYHAQHIEEFCGYVDASLAALRQEILAATPGIVRAELAKKDVEIKVDELSFQAAKKKFKDLIRSIWH